MKERSAPIEVKSGDYLDQALMKGLCPVQKKKAKELVKTFKSMELAVPYGKIRQSVLKLK